MKLTIFGLTISSSWGNGHATLWRGLCRALVQRGHDVVFFERDTPYYAGNRDLFDIPGGRLIFYPDWSAIADAARAHLADADLGIVTSYCPDGRPASTLVLDSAARCKVFYDLDTPITLDRLRQGMSVSYLPDNGLGDFDLVLSYTGGAALQALRAQLGARWTLPLHGSVDPEAHCPAGPLPQYRADLSYLGTYSEDRQETLERLFLAPARSMPRRRFVLAGAQYPYAFPWTDNIFFVRHLPPDEHPAFYGSSRLTLNVTRRAMADMGYCPSGRLFEVATCGTPVLSDWWPGLDQFFEPGKEILVAHDTADVLEAIGRRDKDLLEMGRAARRRTLRDHTAHQRVLELERIYREFREQRGASHVGNHTGGGSGEQDSAAGVLEGALAGRQPHDR